MTVMVLYNRLKKTDRNELTKVTTPILKPGLNKSYYEKMSALSENDEERSYHLSLMKENPKEAEEEPEVNKNQFFSTERGTQTKIFKYNDEALQTDPLPV